MKQITLIILLFGLIACNQPVDQTLVLQKRIDSLEQKLSETYKPGFGEFMSGIQVHHAKLWFAGQNENWKLADFELHEIMEAIEDIQKYETDRKESTMIGIINPAIDSMNYAIQQKNSVLFKSSYVLLTNTCNNCHRQADFGFNVIKIPENIPFTNQEFKVNE